MIDSRAFGDAERGPTTRSAKSTPADDQAMSKGGACAPAFIQQRPAEPITARSPASTIWNGQPNDPTTRHAPRADPTQRRDLLNAQDPRLHVETWCLRHQPHSGSSEHFLGALDLQRLQFGTS
jgi:hypothetical protein